MGDAILCIFPTDSEDEAIRCARELRKTFSEIVRERQISHETELEIGISSGEIEVGIVGHNSLRQKDVFGEEVSQAAIIGHHRGIAITERVYKKIKGHYNIHKLPEVPLKWQEEPLHVWEIQED